MNTPALIPHLICKDATAAIAFYQRALGADALQVLHAPDGTLLHACLQLNGGILYLCDECPAMGALAPQQPGAGPITLHLQVPDCDAVYTRAVAAGCEARLPPQDMFWGDRYGVFVDPYGHSWSVGTTRRRLTDAELRAAAAEACRAPA